MLFVKKSSKLITIAVVIICLLLFLHYIKVLRPLENALVYATKPVLSGVYGLSVKVGNVYSEFKNKQGLIEENKELEAQVNILLQEKSEYLTSSEENEFLRRQLDFLEENKYDFEIARVIGRNVDNTQNALLINKGQKHSLLPGMAVLTGNGELIGKLSRVNPNSAIVLLINDDLSKVAAKIQTKSKTIGIVEGEYGLGIKMHLIPRTEQINEGDIVVTSGLEQLVPANLLIGQVESVINEPEDLFQEASIRAQADFSKITLVNVIK